MTNQTNEQSLQSAVDHGTALRVLDHGFVRLVDVMGDDSAVVQAARVSYASGTKTVNDDRGLIRYLMRNLHTTPFEMCEMKFHVKLPVFVARQWIRHRTASVNEMSGRYSIMPDEFYVPNISNIQPQSASNKQGREGDLPDDVKFAMRESLRQNGEMAFQVYEELHSGWPWFQDSGDLIPDTGNPAEDDTYRRPHNAGHGMARELARINLPLSTYTEFYWKIDLHNLLHFLKLRVDSHAQAEIRFFAEAVSHFVEKTFPLCFEAWVDYRRDAATLSRMEVKALKDFFEALGPGDPEHGEIPHPVGVSLRELNEFYEKIGVKL